MCVLTFIYAAVDCGELVSPENGQVLMFEGTSLRGSAVYNCDQGYLLLGTTVRQCEANGEWSSTEPTCTCEFTMNLNYLYKKCIQNCFFNVKVKMW